MQKCSKPGQKKMVGLLGRSLTDGSFWLMLHLIHPIGVVRFSRKILHMLMQRRQGDSPSWEQWQVSLTWERPNIWTGEVATPLERRWGMELDPHHWQFGQMMIFGNTSERDTLRLQMSITKERKGQDVLDVVLDVGWKRIRDSISSSNYNRSIMKW